MIEIPKPKYCGQEWLDMQPTKGGRTCGKCEKTIYDFSKMPWTQIKEMQLANNKSLCGMYSQSQLDHWGENPNKTSSKRNIFTASALLLGLAHLNTIEAKAQALKEEQMTTTDTSSQVSQTAIPDSSSTIIIRGKITGPDNYGVIDAVAFANIYIPSLNIGCSSDLDGNFILAFNGELAKIQNQTLSVSLIGYDKKEIALNDLKNGINEMNIELSIVDVELIAFYVNKPRLRKRIGWRIRSWFRK